ncbi:hypothetical protein [Methanosarcina sp.]|uniref:hypothetical protein n=1 Tax=Methanosarcina sp. TaxID=2213 RepID=UPI003BB6313D
MDLEDVKTPDCNGFLVDKKLVEDEMQEIDLTTVVLTEKGRSVIESMVQEQKWFKQTDEAARLAISFAIKGGTGLAEKLEQAKPEWEIDRLDNDGKIRSVISIHYPEAESTQIRQISYLIDEGTKIISDFLSKYPSSTLSDLLWFSLNLEKEKDTCSY